MHKRSLPKFMIMEAAHTFPGLLCCLRTNLFIVFMANSKWATSLPTSQATQAPRGALLKTRRTVLWTAGQRPVVYSSSSAKAFRVRAASNRCGTTLMRPMLLPISMFQWKEQQNTPVGNAMFFPVVDLSGHVGTLIGNHDISCWNYNLYSVAFPPWRVHSGGWLPHI